MKTRLLSHHRTSRITGRHRSLWLEAVERRILLANDTIPPNFDEIDLFAESPPPHVQSESDVVIGVLNSQSSANEPLTRFQELQSFDAIDRLALSESFRNALIDIRGDRVVIMPIDYSSNLEPASEAPQNTSPASALDVDSDQLEVTGYVPGNAIAGSTADTVTSNSAPIWIAEPLSQLVDRTYNLNAFAELGTLISFDAKTTGSAFKDYASRYDTYFDTTERFVLHATTDIPRIPMAEPESVADAPPQQKSNPETSTSFSPEPIDIANLPNHIAIQSAVAPPTSIAGTSVASVGDAPLSVEVVVAEAPVYDETHYSLESQEMGPFVRSAITAAEITEFASRQNSPAPTTSKVMAGAVKHQKPSDAGKQAAAAARSQRDWPNANDNALETKSNRITPVKDIAFDGTHHHANAVEPTELAAVNARGHVKHVTTATRERAVSQPSNNADEIIPIITVATFEGLAAEATEELPRQSPTNSNRIFASFAQSVRFGAPYALLAIPLLFCQRYWQLPETHLGPQELIANRKGRRRVGRSLPMRIFPLRRPQYHV